MAEVTTAARPYAQAIFEMARDQEALKEWSDMLTLVADVAADPKLQPYLDNPHLSKARLEGLLLEACGDRLSLQGKNFVRVLVANRRLNLLPEIKALFESQRADFEGMLNAEVISAYPLSEEEQRNIANALKANHKREIRLSCTTDKNLLGGAIIRAGDSVLDGSVRGQLQRLANVLSY